MQDSVARSDRLLPGSRERAKLYGPTSTSRVRRRHCMLPTAGRGGVRHPALPPGRDQHGEPPRHQGASTRDRTSHPPRIRDLKQRGMLDDTLVIGEASSAAPAIPRGRSPRKDYGRDHHLTPRCFTGLARGGGIKPASTYGPDDGLRLQNRRRRRPPDPSENDKFTHQRVHVYDLQRNLQCLGIRPHPQSYSPGPSGSG